MYLARFLALLRKTASGSRLPCRRSAFCDVLSTNTNLRACDGGEGGGRGGGGGARGVGREEVDEADGRSSGGEENFWTGDGWGSITSTNQPAS